MSVCAAAVKTKYRGDDGNQSHHSDPSRDRCPVFQLIPIPGAVVPLDDVRDIYEMCQHVKNTMAKESIYIVNNMDMYGVETYIHTVQYFERCLRATKKQSKR
jgi:hypothetical protein